MPDAGRGRRRGPGGYRGKDRSRVAKGENPVRPMAALGTGKPAEGVLLDRACLAEPARRRSAARRLGLALLLSTAVLGGCSASAAKAVSSAATGGAGGTITVAVAGDFPTLDPARAADTESVSAVQLMYESLFSYNAAGRPSGRLARSWSWSDGGRTLTVDINPRARFADGTAVTSADVAFSLDRMLQAGSGAPEARSFSALVGFAALRAGRPDLATGIEQRGAHVVVFHLIHPMPYLPELLALPSASIVEMRIVEAAGPAAQSAAWWSQHSAGSGPYVLAKHIPGVGLWLRPNPHYWRRGVRVAGHAVGPFAPIQFRVVSDPAAQLALFKEGRLDVIDPLSPAQTAALGSPAHGARLLQGSDLGLSYLGFNTSRPPFNDPRLRLAVAYALDKTAILAAAGDQGQLAGGILPPGIAGYDAHLAPYPYDPTRARSLFGASGVTAPLPVTLLTIAADGTVQQAGADAVAQTVATELDAVGFQVRVRALSWPQYYQQLVAGNAQLFQGEWIADYPDAQDFFFNLLNSASIGVANDSFFSNADFDRRDGEAAATLSPALRAARYARLDRMVYDQVPLLPEFYDETTVLLQPSVRPATAGVFLAPPLMPQLERVWLVPSRAVR